MPKFPVSALILTVFLAFGASPAIAHNELVSEFPAAGSTVEAGIIRINLHFTEAPMATKFGEGNLIAIANAETGEQLGAACAVIQGTTLATTASISTPGKYKILWRSVADDGHVASGDYLITVVNNSNYSSDQIGNRCIDEQGNALDVSKQELLSRKIEQNDGFLQGLGIGALFIVIGSLVGGLLLKRRQKTKIEQN
ncbi:MAG: copper resistance CopC family protein [Actinomycetes bacterium]